LRRMSVQPSGTVTLVFTDIEGSTRLLHELGEAAYRDALGEHRRLVRESFGRLGGYEVDYEGDSFFYAFQAAAAAVAAVCDAMGRLASGPIRIRVGIHTGTPVPDPPKYVGIDVHAAARIMSAGHGGQVLLSKATCEQVAEDLACTDLGEHRLKDLVDPVWLYQLGSEQFPPLKTISNTNLPRPANALVGREQELRHVTSLLQSGARLLTLSGPGGSGKSRLALEAAAELVLNFPNGVFWVELAPLRDPAVVMDTIARTVGSRNGLADHVGERKLLLVLDNLEQVVEAAPSVASLVEACRNLRVLVTSRERLSVRGEVEYVVPPLAEREAVELFCARSGLAADDAVGELCGRLDFLPLAIELAAARTSVLSPMQILERLAERLDLLKGGRDADARHLTLRATIGWSHELLSRDEQHLFARLSVFVGGCTLEAAETVTGADLDMLQALVEKSLVRRGRGRFWMLETVRQYAEEQLAASGESGDVRERHALYFLESAEAFEQGLLRTPDVANLLDRLEDERENVRAALAWAREFGAVEMELRLATALRDFWRVRGPITEGLHHLEEAVQRAGDHLPERRFEALRFAALQALQVGEYVRAEGLAGQARELARVLGDQRGESSALIKLGHAAHCLGRPADAWSSLEEALSIAHEVGDPETVARALLNLGDLAANEGDFARAAALSEQSLQAGGAGLNASVRAVALHNLAAVRIKLGEAGDATYGPLVDALTLSVDLGDNSLAASCLEQFAAAGVARDPLRAATLLGAAHVVIEEVGSMPDEEIADEVLTAPGEAQGPAYNAGRELSLGDAVAYALDGVTEPTRSGRGATLES
jgi:predicted ATPase/class 3 adenylate cyclase